MIQSKEIKLKINGKNIKALFGQSILEVAQKKGIEIPNFCYHPDLDAKATCRVCAVEIRNPTGKPLASYGASKKGLYTACSTKAEDGMEIFTESAKVRRARKINLELIVSQHCEDCDSCRYNLECKLKKFVKKYEVLLPKFEDRKIGYPVFNFGPAVIFNTSKCINCRNCVEVCSKQTVDFFELQDKNGFFEVFPTKDTKKDCVYCGQCVLTCPVSSLEITSDCDAVEKELKNKNKKVVFQFAPSIRTSIGEEFGLKPGTIVTEKLISAIKKLGAYKVFDTSVGADFTTTEEAKELLEKIKKGTGSCLSSCCPAWVKYVEFNYPEFIQNLATARSPQIILGGVIKTYWAGKEKIKPEKIIVVSVMPCIAKKYEIKRKELMIKNLMPVDYVLTTRELAGLFKKYKIDLTKIVGAKIDDPWNLPSGGGVIYGASGGVAESALRNAFYEATNKKLAKVDFKQVRGMEGIKKAQIKLGNKTIRMAVVNGLGNAKKILEELKQNPKAYCAVEVMACPGGCIGGGGQPIPVNRNIRKQRAEALYDIDSKKKIRAAYENPIIQKVYKEFLNTPNIIHEICHTKYYKKQKENKFNSSK